MNLTISSMKFFSEIKAEYHMSYHTTIWWLSNGTVLLNFLKLKVETGIFLNNKNPSQPVTEQWMAVEISFCYRFGISQWIWPKIRRPTALTCKIHTEVKSFQGQLTLSESQIMSSCFIHFRCYQKLRLKFSTVTHVCGRCIFQSQTTVPAASFRPKYKYFPHFKNHLTVQQGASCNSQLEVIIQ